MIETLLDGALFPFSLALMLLLGLLVLEIAMLLIGGSLIGGSDGPDTPAIEAGTGLGGVDVDLADFDLDPDLISGDLDLVDGSISGPGSNEINAVTHGGLAAWLGFGKTPLLIWLATLLATFGIAGVALQVASDALVGNFLPAGLVALPAGVFGLWFARGFATVFARVLPQTTTQVISERSMGRRRGVITQGTATRGRPAEVKITDGYGNTHYLRAEPMADDEALEVGTDVLVLRHRPTGTYRLIALSE